MTDLFWRRDFLQALGVTAASTGVSAADSLPPRQRSASARSGVDASSVRDRRRVQPTEDGPLGVLWRHELPSRCSSPVYINGQVVVGTEEGLHVLNPESGDQTAVADLGRLSNSNPITDEQSVYVGTDEGQTSRVLSVRPSSGFDRTLLETEFIDSQNTAVPYGMTRDAGTLFVPANATGVYAVSTSSGETEWQFTPDAPASARLRTGGTPPFTPSTTALPSNDAATSPPTATTLPTQ